MKTTYSLHKIEQEHYYPFNANKYSWFKFGDTQFAAEFAADLFAGFIEKYAAILIENENIVVLPSPYLSIPTASNFLCSYFKKHVDMFLFENGKNASIESKIFRNQTYVTDYGNLCFEERVKLISNDTYYIDKDFIQDKLCIFVDDIKITGSHEHTINKILDQYNVDGKFIFIYFAELVNKNIHPKIENHYNYFAVKTTNDIIDVVNRKSFKFNTRIVKYILKLSEFEFEFLVKKISKQKTDELFQLAISNNYHQMPAYKQNINSLRIKSDFNKDLV